MLRRPKHSRIEVVAPEEEEEEETCHDIKKKTNKQTNKQGMERERKRQRLLLSTRVHHPKTYISLILVSE